MASDDQLTHLKAAKSWYIDGTFKIVKAPFTQLMTINCFVKKDSMTKQLPLCYVLMSGRKTKDYR